jgi:hypothetical protein
MTSRWKDKATEAASTGESRRAVGGVNFYAVVPLAKSTFFRKHRAQFEAEGIIPAGR